MTSKYCALGFVDTPIALQSLLPSVRTVDSQVLVRMIFCFRHLPPSLIWICSRNILQNGETNGDWRLVQIRKKLSLKKQIQDQLQTFRAPPRKTSSSTLGKLWVGGGWVSQNFGRPKNLHEIDIYGRTPGQTGGYEEYHIHYDFFLVPY